MRQTDTQLPSWPDTLRAFRQRNGLKQEAAAALLGVSQAYVSRVENGSVRPSMTFVKRLSTLITEPAHRPILDLIKVIVRDAPTLTCLLSLKDGIPYIEARSRAFDRYGPPFDSQVDGQPADFGTIGRDGELALTAVARSGAFKGQVGMIEGVWMATPPGGPDQAFHSVHHPVRTDDGDWMLFATSTPISSVQLKAATTAWGGPVRFFNHDEARPDGWP